ncbi:JmjC-domain-containing protein [Metschnikowia bicuspidata var. bicuspidata NRRL YB-4993]|uniref:JmjC-domain-containing protein n=1 Tax=Metschnikowia bicuspidata var. bicuspidata NRRL YB-4993 TaxID=869754 RepID=A0A1A0HEG9_9ASCO|nr:JmjC-domain-containing protein [Metschnikowia bicuspidata var. bicuspidata NRRL YB-4993]OBA22297.1 JmjC-domain-containing protein [Metschnikowia bicuspidata var. bicuspidata NRRL YB-4993]
MPFDKSLLRECPTLYPSHHEFDDPIMYMSSPEVKDLGRKHGLVKIVPPAPWKPPFSLSPSFTFHTRIQKLSDLGITSRSRKFFVDNLNRFFKMSNKAPVNEWLVSRSKNIHCYDLYLAVSKTSPEAVATGDIPPEELAKINILFQIPSHSDILLKEYRRKILPYAKYLSSNGNHFDFPVGNPGDSESCVICKKNHSPTTTLLCDNCDDQFHMRCLLPPLEEVPKGSWYCDKCLIGTGEYGFEENREVKYTLQQFYHQCLEFEQKFSADFGIPGQRLTLDELEKIFWNLVEEENSLIKVKYGADIHNLKMGEITGFPTSEYANPAHIYQNGQPVDPTFKALHEVYAKHPWNLTQLPFARGSLLNHIETEISGMTVPWIYVGSLLSTFCWHVEDHYTLSANYCHFGSTKKWYGIPSAYADQFEKYLRSLAPDLFQRQPDLLHQLVTLISPSKLALIGIPCVYADQNPNEFVITFPRVYHAGFNSGFNFNEAVNFTMDSWLDFGDRSIQDYKLIKKENVFDHYKLLENILKSFSGDRLGSWNNRTEIVGKCIRDFENYVHRQMSLVRDLESDKLKAVLLSSKKENTTNGSAHTSILTPKSPKHEMISRASEEDDNLCDICRVSISYQYCDINNRNHRFGKWYQGRQKKESRVLAVNKLLTPDPSPCLTEGSTSLPRGSAEEIALSQSAEALQDLQDSEEDEIPTSSDQFEELIRQAKRKMKEEEDLKDPESSGAKRRQLRRLEAKKFVPQQVSTEPERGKLGKMSQMKKVQYSSLLHLLNQLDHVKLCLECTAKMCGTHGEKVPKGSQILLKKGFEDMQSVLEEAKDRYFTLLER